MPLRILVIGAGIAGLSTAVALAQAGHRVLVAEKSRFAAEVGAALVLAPNGARVLAALGFSFERARAVELPQWETVDGRDLAPLAAVDFAGERARHGHPMRAVHRVDLHTELFRLAREVSDNGVPGRGRGEGGGGGGSVEIRLKASVVRMSATEGRAWLEDGECLDADLIVGADGVHSVARREVVREVSGSSEPVMNAFRFLVPTERMEADESLRWLRRWKKAGSTIFVDTKDPASQRHVVWYDCQGGQVQNLVGLHPPRSDVHEGGDSRALLLDEFKEFHPDLLKLLRLADHVKCWPLSYYDPFPRWSSDKIVLVGDAGHPMLPLSGQAANQALEDAGALGFLFKDVHTADQVPETLRKYEEVRRKRGSMIQILSSTLVGREKEVYDKLLEFTEEGEPVPSTFQERLAHANSFDVFARCEEIVAKSTSNLNHPKS